MCTYIYICILLASNLGRVTSENNKLFILMVGVEGTQMTFSICKSDLNKEKLPTSSPVLRCHLKDKCSVGEGRCG